MKTLNRLINDYTRKLQQGELQLAYKGILDYLGRLRSDFIKKYPQLDIGSLYQGYMDMTYFSLNTKTLKDKGLKIAIVYLHQNGRFEAWLSARNREISKQYETVISDKLLEELQAFHDKNNLDAIIERTLASAPDFDDPDILTNQLEQGAEQFIAAVSKHLDNPSSATFNG